MTTAAYDAIADWYETEFLRRQGDADPLGVTRALRELLGRPADAGGTRPEVGPTQGPESRPSPDPGTHKETSKANSKDAMKENSEETSKELSSDASSQSRDASSTTRSETSNEMCLEIGCGTGVHAATVRELGWAPVGVDVSAGMLRHAVGRLGVVRADSKRLPFASDSVPAVIAVWVHTDMPAYPAVVREVARVLRPGGVFVHVGTHPCFCGGFADRSDLEAVVIRPGYLDGHWTKESYTDQGIRDKVGASHWPLPALLSMVVGAGLVFERFTEGGAPSPAMLAWAARKPRPSSAKAE